MDQNPVRHIPCSLPEKRPAHPCYDQKRQSPREILPMKMPLSRPVLLLTLVLLSASAGWGQIAPNPLAAPTANPLTNPSASPGTAFLFNLEAKFAQDTATGGGKAFASWFADDAVTLGNKEAPVLGKMAIAANANWDASKYQLSWTPQGGAMSPAGDMGFTWGHYEGTSKDKNGNPVKTTGRYMTIWKKMPDGSWKVALDSSNDEPPNAGDCCKLP
jgi:ketosteroid isomerase-like protein